MTALQRVTGPMREEQIMMRGRGSASIGTQSRACCWASWQQGATGLMSGLAETACSYPHPCCWPKTLAAGPNPNPNPDANPNANSKPDPNPNPNPNATAGCLDAAQWRCDGLIVGPESTAPWPRPPCGPPSRTFSLACGDLQLDPERSTLTLDLWHIPA